VIPVLFVIHWYLYILDLHYLNIMVKYCRPRSSNWRPYGRPIARGWRLWRPSALRWSRDSSSRWRRFSSTCRLLGKRRV
jgi:hypothetical protein